MSRNPLDDLAGWFVVIFSLAVCVGCALASLGQQVMDGCTHH